MTRFARSIWVMAGGESKYLFLLLSQLALFVLHALIGAGPVEQLVIAFAEFLVLASTVRAVASHKRLGIVVTTLGALAVIASVPAHATTSLVVDVAWNALVAAFLTLAAVLILRDIFRGQAVTSDTIRGAVCVYLLLGLTWAFYYNLVDLLVPDAFRFAHFEVVHAGIRGPLIYFSFVTLTTLGYGDITPVAAPARALVLFEAVLGQLFLAIMVARLVGLHVVHQANARPDRD